MIKPEGLSFQPYLLLDFLRAIVSRPYKTDASYDLKANCMNHKGGCTPQRTGLEAISTPKGMHVTTHLSSTHLQPSRLIPTRHNSSSKANFLVQDGGGVMGHIPHSTPQHSEHYLVPDYKMVKDWFRYSESLQGYLVIKMSDIAPNLASLATAAPPA
ncbi:hypothetical protein VNO77_04069 [Canavalia gladiata]|uniref:Uncharacterized protein n=1 Tax=Canavalia gladiata TaxID=3824 RepID=A0AAN9N2D5_CANGL